MVEVEESGLFLIEDDEVTHIHTTKGDHDFGSLLDYLEEYDLMKQVQR